MDTRTGQIADLNSFLKRFDQDELDKFVKPIDVANLSQRNRRELYRIGTVTVGQRSRCPCGSGHRFKRCCMYKGGVK